MPVQLTFSTLGVKRVQDRIIIKNNKQAVKSLWMQKSDRFFFAHRVDIIGQYEQCAKYHFACTLQRLAVCFMTTDCSTIIGFYQQTS